MVMALTRLRTFSGSIMKSAVQWNFTAWAVLWSILSMTATRCSGVATVYGQALQRAWKVALHTGEVKMYESGVITKLQMSHQAGREQ
jgi:hypothetical protein